jgi:antitoxin component of MazEF toxin-antitoxin module
MTRQMRTEIKKWGNSAALRLPAATLAKAGMEVNSPVEIKAVEGKLVVSAVESPHYNLDELLAQCPPKKMALSREDKQWLESEPVGKEV